MITPLETVAFLLQELMEIGEELGVVRILLAELENELMASNKPSNEELRLLA